jgi:glycosyltransferase involved in cell wall biosynthesis
MNKDDNNIDYSIVVPVYNEDGSLDQLITEINNVIGIVGGVWEIIFVNDGSSDNSLDVLLGHKKKQSNIKIINFRRNFGKSAVYSAAFDSLRGDIVFTLDADLQDDPNEIPNMLQKYREGYDLVVGWKQGRLENEPHKALPSKVFNGLISKLFGIQLHDSNCGFRVMSKLVAKTLELHGDQYRFIPELAAVQGYSVSEQGVNHRKRKHGKSKYGPKRFWTGLLDLLTVWFTAYYRHRPLHFIGTAGLFLLIYGSLLEGYVLISKLLGDTFQSHIAALVIGVMFIITGLQFILTGLIGEMLSQQNREKKYITEKVDVRSSA